MSHQLKVTDTCVMDMHPASRYAKLHPDVDELKRVPIAVAHYLIILSLPGEGDFHCYMIPASQGPYPFQRHAASTRGICILMHRCRFNSEKSLLTWLLGKSNP